MNLRPLAFTLLLVTSSTVHAQAPAPDTSLTPSKGWRTSLDGVLQTSQAAYSDNWVGGEIGSVNWAFATNFVAERAFSTKLANKSTLKLAFGQTASQVRDANNKVYWERPKKSTDLIDFETVFRFTFGGFVDPYLAARVESKFYDDSIRVLKRWFHTTKITESGGILKKLVDKPKEFELTSRFGFAFRQIMVANVIDVSQIDNIAPTSERKISNDGGPESVTDLLVKLNKSVTYTSKLSLYKALFFSEKDKAVDDDWKMVDANWEHFIVAQVAKNLQTILYFQFLYDKEIVDQARIKETLGLGLSVKM